MKKYLLLLFVSTSLFAESPFGMFPNPPLPLVDKSQEFVNAQYYGMRADQNLSILKVKMDYLNHLTKLGSSATQEEKDKLLEEYQKRVGILISKFTEDNAKLNVPQPVLNMNQINPYLNQPMYGNNFCVPNSEQTICQSPDGRVYKLDHSTNQLGRKMKKILDEADKAPFEADGHSQSK